MTEKEYKSYRNKYRPKKLKAIFIGESPPNSGKYFYKPEGKISEPLFKNFMEAMDIPHSTKAEGLKEFARRGYFLIDATYTPVNGIKDTWKRTEAIFRDFCSFFKDLRFTVGKNKHVLVVFVKVNVFDLYAPFIRGEYNMIDERIPFPSRWNRKSFLKKMKHLLSELDSDTSARRSKSR